MIVWLNANSVDKMLWIYMKTARRARPKKKFEPFYSDILKLSKKKQTTLVAARKELIRKATKQK